MFEFTERLKHAWNAFTDKSEPTFSLGESWGLNPSRIRHIVTNDRSIINTIKTKIAVDVTECVIRHCKVDSHDRMYDWVYSGLDACLNIEANIDQTGRAFRQDIIATMLDEGVVAVVPVETSLKPSKSTSYIIRNMRVGKIVGWFPDKVRVRLYNEWKGVEEEVVLPKKQVAIIENPFYSIMNEPNSIYQRLIRKLTLLDSIDSQSGAGKLDLIVQVPYTLKTDRQRMRAESRRADLESQLANSKFGVVYLDAAEKVTQLNRPIENGLMNQVKYLSEMLYNQLGVTQKVFDGTADEKEMLNYYNGTIKPIVESIVDELSRKFITKTARAQGHRLKWIRDPFAYIPMSGMADIADKFTRNQILSPNEIRGIIGFKPVDDPEADELRNRNLNISDTQGATDDEYEEDYGYEEA